MQRLLTPVVGYIDFGVIGYEQTCYFRVTIRCLNVQRCVTVIVFGIEFSSVCQQKFRAARFWPLPARADAARNVPLRGSG